MGNFSYEYPRPALTVDIVIFCLREACLQVLLIRRRDPPFAGKWALPGGFVRMEESLEAAAYRELEEETGVKVAYLEQLYTYGEPDRDPRGRTVTVAHYALLPNESSYRASGGSDASEAGWFPVDTLPRLAFDHDEITQYALKRLREKLEYTAIGFELLPEEFTLSELQQTFELILGEQIEKRIIRRRMMQAEIIEPTSSRRSGGGRPAQLYRYRPDAVAELRAQRLFP